MRRHSALVTKLIFGTVAMLMLVFASVASRAQFATPVPPYLSPFTVPVPFDGLDWLTDRGGILFDNVAGSTTYGNLNVYPQRKGHNNVGPYGTPTPALDPHRGLLRWVFPRTVDLSTVGGTFTCTVDNPYAGWNKSDANIFYDSSQPIDATSRWLGPGFTIPPLANRTGQSGFSFAFTPADPTNPADPNPPADMQGDYGYTAAVHNDFVVNRGTNASGPATVAELANMPNVDYTVYKAVNDVLVNEYKTLANPIAQWTIGTTLNTNYPAGSLVPYDGAPNPPNPATAPNARVVKYKVDLYSPGSGTILNDGFNHPNVGRAFVRVSWKNTVNTATNAINPGSPNGSGGYVAGAGGVNDPVNSRIYLVDLSAPGWIHLGPANSSAASFPYGGGSDQIVVTLFSVTPDDPNDTTLYLQTPIVTADACRFVEQDTSSTPDPTNPPAVSNLGPLNDPLNPNVIFVGQSGRFLGPVVGTNKFTTDGSTLWYCVREEVIPNQARIATDPTQPITTTTNPLIIDPAVTSTAPVFYCLTNENNVITQATSTTAEVDTLSKNRVVWRYVGFPDGGVATSFTSPVVANVRARDGNYHTIVYFCSTSNNEQGGLVGRIYALDALGDTVNTDPTKRTTQTTAYWTYPSLRPLEAAEIPAPTGTAALGTSLPNQYHDPNYTNAVLADPLGIYSANDSTKYGASWQQGYWWADDQVLFNSGSQRYYDGDIVPGTGGSFTVKTDTQIVIGGITGAPVVLNDPGNPTGPMILAVPSLDGRIYCFDAGGRGDFNNSKALPTPPVDPTNPTLPAGTLSVLGLQYQVPGTTQRLWCWPHYGADAYHQIYPIAAIPSHANLLADEASKGAMPFSPAYDSSWGQDDPRNTLMVSGGSNGENGELGTGHVYGLIPAHDGPVRIGSNNVPIWNVVVNAGLIAGTTDRRYWSWPFESDSSTTASAQPLTDIPSVISVYPQTKAGYAYFSSGGRVYSLQLPNALPGPGHYTPPLNWVYPYTPPAYIPFQNPNDTSTAEFSQGFAPKGLSVLSATVAGTTNDMVYALLTDGTVIGIEANPPAPPQANATNFIAAGTSLLGSFTESAPTLTAIAPDPNLDASVRPAPGTSVTLAASVPTLLFGDDAGATYCIGTKPRQYTDGAGGFITKLPLLYARQDASDSVATQPALAASTRTLAAGAVPPIDSAGHVLNSQPYYGGYFVLGSSDGQLRAYSLGRFANGYGDSAGAGEPTTNLGGQNDVTIDVRAFDAFTDYRVNPPAGYNLREFTGIAPRPGQSPTFTPARREDDTKYSNTATRARSNVPSASPVSLALDQGGNLYLAASGVYHAQPEDNTLNEYGASLPSITVTFTVSQPGMPPTTYTQTVAPVTRNPNNKGARANDPWPDDLAISASDKNNLHIYGVDNNNPSGTPNPTGDGSAAQRLTGPTQNVYPWAAKQLVQIIPRNINGQTSFAPNTTGYTVTVHAEITQPIRTSGSNRTIQARNDAYMKLGQRYAQGLSNSPYPPDINDSNNPAIYPPDGQQRGLYITNPLGLTVRNYNNVNDMTGLGALTNPNVIGWAGPVDNPITNVDEITGNGSFVGLSATNPANPANPTNPAANGNGYRKPIFAPFGMWQDNSSPRYLVNQGGTQAPGIFLMDRSDLARVTGQPVKVHTTLSPLRWNGTAASVLNPLPFEDLPNREKVGGTVDYRPIDIRNATFSVKGVDATANNVGLLPPTNPTVGTPNVDPSARIPVPTPVELNLSVPKFTPANVNRGQIAFNYRGKTINIGDTWTDLAGYVRGYHGVGTAAGAIDARVSGDILGPLNTATGLASTNASAGTPSGGYVGDVSVQVVPLGGTTTTGGPGAFQRGTTAIISRQFQTGIAVAPAFRSRVLETTLDVGKVPHGMGYSDLVGSSYRFPFAPSGTGPYISTGANPTILYSPWDNDAQFSAANVNGLINDGSANGLTIGRFFRPFTWVNESNVNFVHPRVAKLVGPHSVDASATPNLGDVINQSSLGINPGYGIANSVRLASDQINNLLTPPLFATPFGQSAPGGGSVGFLGNIGVVSSFDHDSYAQGILSELNLYPLYNPAIDAAVVQTASELFNAGYLATDLYAKGGNVPFGVNLQGRPTIHKARVGDGSGTIATIPDQPHDFQNALQSNNSTQQGIYANLQTAGLFNLPAMSIAVPMGTPTGTYSAPIYPYEDGLPLQWLEWLSASSAAGSSAQSQALGNDDDILNTNQAGVPVEPFANPAPTLRITVRENQLTQGVIAGVMPQIDVRNTATALNGQTFYNALGFNVQPTAIMLPGPITNGNTVYNNKIMLYWTTNRASDVPNPSSPLFPTPTTPYNLAYTSVYTPYSYNSVTKSFRGDAQFTGSLFTDLSNIGLPQWWGVPDKTGTQRPYALLPGTANSAATIQALFNLSPVTYPGINTNTFRMGSPATTLATNYNVATGTYDATDSEAYLFSQGSIDAGNQTLTRTFYTSLNNRSGSSILGAPDYGLAGAVDGLLSFANDPAVPKLSPRPLLVKLHNETINGATTDAKFLYVFWHSGSQGRTALYYNVNVQTAGLNADFPANGFNAPTGPADPRLGDQKLDTPAALTWQSDPYPVFRRVYDPTTNQVVDAIDVMFTGTLKNRQAVEILGARYRIVTTNTPANGSQPALKVGQLVAIPFPTVHQDVLSRIPGTSTWAARDAGWFLPSDTQSADTAANRYARVYLQPFASGASYQINGLTQNAATATANQSTQRGRVDPASGLVYFNALATDPNTGAVVVNGAGRPIYGGGQIVVDPKSGTVNFPNITPGDRDTVRASYTPYLIRVNTSRDDFNIDRDISDLWAVNGGPLANNTSPFGSNGILANMLVQARPSTASAGQNYAPTYILDRAPNSRANLISPQVVFNPNGSGVSQTLFGPPIDRKWVLYRKSDSENRVKTVYLKAQRLMVKLPRPVALAAVNSPPVAQAIANLVIQRYDPVSNSFVNLRKGFEVDWVRGRIYFQEEDEGDVVQVSYTYYDPATNSTGSSGNLYYRVDWGDEISSAFHPYDQNSKWAGDDTTAEVQMPTSSTVNEGNVAAFKDPYIDKLWVFWSSQRGGGIGPTGTVIPSSDLFFQTLAPQFYPTASNQY